MIVAYIIAGTIVGLHSVMIMRAFSVRDLGRIPPSNVMFLGFAGGVGGHALYTLLNS